MHSTCYARRLEKYGEFIPQCSSTSVEIIESFAIDYIR